MEVPMKSGASEWVILHIEAQSRGSDLNIRMSHYRSAIFFHYRKEPVALAIVTDKRPANEAVYYSHSHFGTESVYRYNRLVLLELDDDALLANENPIGILLYAAKNALRAKAEHQKYRYLRIAMDRLAERGWDRKDKHDLMLFIERIIDLQDEELIAEYSEHRLQLDKEGKIMYIQLMEREKAKELVQSGIEKGKEEMARNLLANGVSPDVIAKSAELPIEKIRKLMN
jgi:predicted transposase/invertase (TIGR01784 family)